MRRFDMNASGFPRALFIAAFMFVVSVGSGLAEVGTESGASEEDVLEETRESLRRLGGEREGEAPPLLSDEIRQPAGEIGDSPAFKGSPKGPPGGSLGPGDAGDVRTLRRYGEPPRSYGQRPPAYGEGPSGIGVRSLPGRR